eukprot:2249450-Rhodomonas_salina.3
MATTGPGIKVEELSDDEMQDLCTSSSDSDYEECEQYEWSSQDEEPCNTKGHMNYMVSAT